MLPLDKISDEQIQKIKIMFFDFDGVFTDNHVYVSESGEEIVKCSRLDGIGISKVKSLNLVPVIISSEKNKVVEQRAKKLGLICHQNIHNKAEKVQMVCNEYGVNAKEQLFVGNDENDISALEVVGISIAVKDYHHSIANITKYVTQLNGGKGAVREVCDYVFSRKKLISNA